MALVIRFLPPTSHLKRKINPDAADLMAWGPTEYLLADLFDLTVKTVQWRGAGPKPYPRPHEAVMRRQRAEQRQAALEAQNERIQQRQLEGGS